jgi:ABC-type branched-subunit amino acid transport system substrate-binding protein
MKRWTWALGMLVLLFPLWFTLHLVQAQNGPVFRIGVLDDPRGALSNGARLAVEEINAEGGVRGADGTFFRLELIIQPIDDITLDEAIANLQQASIIAILGPADDEDVLNGFNALEALNVPILTQASGDTTLGGNDSRRFFRTRAADVYEGRALANYVINELQLARMATVQMDVELESTARTVGFTIAASNNGITPQPALQVQNNADLDSAIEQVIEANPQLVVVYGDLNRTTDFYNTLRAEGYAGAFAYDQADDPRFQSSIAPELLQGILGTTSWPFTATDEISVGFRDRFIRLYGSVPGAMEAATYDGVMLLAEAIGRPGDLQTNLAQIQDYSGVQGVLSPADFEAGDVSNTVAVTQLGEFGVPQVLARYAGNQRLDLDEPIQPTLTPLPSATPTPEGVVATIQQARQNVRSGPSTAYDVLGQLSEGEQVRVIGATTDLTWVVIQYRGVNGWLATYLLEVFGDLNTVPIIQPPPTPTPAPTSTPQPAPDIIITSATVVPSPIIAAQPFSVNVTVQNIGSVPVGSFAIAATFPPNNVFSSAIVGGLAGGQSTVATLTGTLSNTGCYSVVIVVDLNNEVNEVNGENNNLFNFSYCVNKPILRQGSFTLNPGDNLDLEGNAVQPDVNWNVSGNQLDALTTARINLIAGVTLESAHYDLINPGIINLTTIPRTSLLPGTVIGVITADGNRGVIRVDGLPGNQLQITFVLYAN